MEIHGNMKINWESRNINEHSKKMHGKTNENPWKVLKSMKNDENDEKSGTIREDS